MDTGSEGVKVPAHGDRSEWQRWGDLVLAQAAEHGGPLILDVDPETRIHAGGLSAWRAVAEALRAADISWRCRPETSPAAAALRLLAGHAPVAGGRVPPLDVAIEPDGVVRLSPHRDLGLEPEAAATWLRCVETPAVVISLAEVQQVDSLLIAWMLQVRSALGDDRLQVREASRRVANLLRQMRLDEVLGLVDRRASPT